MKTARHMSKLSVIAMGSVILNLPGLHPAAAAPVHIEVDTGRSQEHGAGISVGKGSECFVVTPMHVVEFARKITVTDRRGHSARAVRFQAQDGVDAALLKVQAGNSLDCPEDWDNGVAGEAALNDVPFLISRKVKQRGIQRRRLFLGGETSQDITLQPYTPTAADRLVEGDSGSSLYAGESLVGMICSVNTATGAGRAIKQTQLDALFGSLVVEQSAGRAVVNPVYQGYSENKYATVALRDFIDERTDFRIVELSNAETKTNVQNLRRGTAPVYPDGVDYVFSVSIIDDRSRQESNPNYKASAARESNFGKQLLNSLGNRSVRYIHVENIDVEVNILEPKSDRRFTHIEQLEYKVPLTDDVDRQKLKKQLSKRAAVEAMSAAMQKYGLPLLAEKEERVSENENVLQRMFHARGQD